LRDRTLLHLGSVDGSTEPRGVGVPGEGGRGGEGGRETDREKEREREGEGGRPPGWEGAWNSVNLHA
jgi:hypothetical protein